MQALGRCPGTPSMDVPGQRPAQAVAVAWWHGTT